MQYSKHSEPLPDKEDPQRRFMIACGQSVHKINYPQLDLYKELVREEVVKELFPAAEAWLANPIDEEALRELIDAIGDSLVVVRGMALSIGLDPDVILSRINHSNLTKIPKDGDQVLRRDDGKILKPYHFQDPDLSDLIEITLNRIVSHGNTKNF